ncbi:MAG: hypothetical protein CML02_22280 [Pseudooceanicola sp.]|nr:hypothetical protein [Pseudooceanicola sp.]|tara:strand:- start:167 stop:712 length:546 start_codon:yes stop_codon:yes gene_type:complete
MGWITTILASGPARKALGLVLAVLTIVLFLLNLRRAGERAGRLAERLSTTEKIHDIQRQMLDAASRPHTSNDNPFSEAHFKTLKYQPEFPRNFETIEQARTFCRRFFAWYNQDHHHAGIGLMTPDQIHFGQAETVHAARQATLDAAFLSTPERFVHKPPKPPRIPTAVWINPPKPTEPNQA